MTHYDFWNCTFLLLRAILSSLRKILNRVKSSLAQSIVFIVTDHNNSIEHWFFVASFIHSPPNSGFWNQ